MIKGVGDYGSHSLPDALLRCIGAPATVMMLTLQVSETNHQLLMLTVRRALTVNC